MEPQSRTEYGYGKSSDPDASSFHLMLVGTIVTAAITIGLASSLWINKIDSKPRAYAPPSAPLLARSAPGYAAEERVPAIEPKPAAAQDSVAPSSAPAASLAAVDANPPQTPAVESQREAEPGSSPAAPENPPIEPAPSAKPETAAAPETLKAAPKIKAAQNATARHAAPPAAATTPRKKPKTHSWRKSGTAPAVAAGRDRNEEIDRLKSQAFSETSGDRVGHGKSRQNAPASDAQFLPQSRARESGSTAAPVKRYSVAGALAQCERIPNFFSRERCKWRICDGQWGKNGCPSYETKSTIY